MIHYVTGDATEPRGDGPKLIVHICNDIGAWGKGFVLAVSKKYKPVEDAYRDWYRQSGPLTLGEVQFVQARPDIWVANMIGQHGIRRAGSKPPIRYDAVESCLQKAAAKARELGAAIHMPRIGCGLAGGDWARIERLIRRELADKCLDVYVYDFER